MKNEKKIDICFACLFPAVMCAPPELSRWPSFEKVTPYAARYNGHTMKQQQLRSMEALVGAL